MKLSSLLIAGALTAFTVAACGGVADIGGTSPTSASPAADHESPDAGSSTAPPVNDASTPAALDPALAARAAIFVGSCVPDNLSNRILQAMYDTPSAEVLERLVRSSPSCFAAKTNGCAAVTDCLGVTVTKAASCTPACDGDTRIDCDKTLAFRMDCARSGRTCAMSAGRSACVPVPAQPCDAPSFTFSCADGRPAYCDYGAVEEGPTCSDFGLACVPKSSGGTTYGVCAGTGPACAPDSFNPRNAVFGGIACQDAATLHACVNTFETVRDCASVGTGFTCRSAGGTAFCGLASECTPGGLAPPTCDGTSLVICNAGKIEKHDSTKLGFTGCNAAIGICGDGPM
jgi:hypothetical protein